jgi:hypothetical protein
VLRPAGDLLPDWLHDWVFAQGVDEEEHGVEDIVTAWLHLPGLALGVDLVQGGVRNASVDSRRYFLQSEGGEGERRSMRGSERSE